MCGFRVVGVFLSQVVHDPATGMSKGYGFVRFTNSMDRDRCVGPRFPARFENSAESRPLLMFAAPLVCALAALLRPPTPHCSAIAEMNGQMCGSRPMRVSLATPKTRPDSSMSSGGGFGGMSMGGAPHGYGAPSGYGYGEYTCECVSEACVGALTRHDFVWE